MLRDTSQIGLQVASLPVQGYGGPTDCTFGHGGDYTSMECITVRTTGNYGTFVRVLEQHCLLRELHSNTRLLCHMGG